MLGDQLDTLVDRLMTVPGVEEARRCFNSR
jgi:hypothetical protein